MLSLAKLGRGSGGYYLDAVAQGAEDYYVGRGEAPGYWAGRGAELLGLDGEVTQQLPSQPSCCSGWQEPCRPLKPPSNPFDGCL